MIKVTNLNKYFNRNKANEIHVINKTTLEFPEKGFVAITGPSGCGKTTLLNVISGLDDAYGNIEFNQNKFNSYSSNNWDKIRANNIGFIFQNFYLLEDRSIYDNIKLTLNMIGITNEEEVNNRINYCLEAVGLFRFRKRLASDLSIGQKQRVGIARAIAKNPDVIIADEPTGNLDLKNSVEIIKIIKKISLEKLVILVTHNESLANNYADRIIKIEDGRVVKDENNESSVKEELEYDDKVIYLGDLNKELLNENITSYQNDNEQYDLTIIKVNNQLYLKSNDPNLRINVIDSKSKLKLVEGKKEIIKDEREETSFSLNELDNFSKERIKKSNISFKESFIEALRKFVNVGRKTKMQIVSLILLGMLFSVSVHVLFSNLFFDESLVIADSNVYRSFGPMTNKPNYDESKYITYDLGYTSYTFVTGKKGYSASFEGFLPIEAVKENMLTNGRMPTNIYEIVVDETILDSKSELKILYNMNGIFEVKDLLGEQILMGYEFEDEILTIVGTVKTGTKTWYGNTEFLNHLLTKDAYHYEKTPDQFEYSLYEFNYKPSTDLVVSEGRKPVKLDSYYKEIVISQSFYEEIKDNLDDFEISFGVEVVGRYADTSEKVVYISEEDYNIILNKRYNSRITVYSVDGTNPDPNLFYNVREDEIGRVKDSLKTAQVSTISQMAFAISVSSLIFFFLVRSSLTRRIKEVSIYRALGVHKREIKTTFALEYLITTLMTSVIGVILGTYILSGFNETFFGAFISIRVTPLSFLAAVVSIIIFNVLIALIPVTALLRKKPANLLSHFDM